MQCFLLILYTQYKINGMYNKNLFSLKIVVAEFKFKRLFLLMYILISIITWVLSLAGNKNQSLTQNNTDQQQNGKPLLLSITTSQTEVRDPSTGINLYILCQTNRRISLSTYKVSKRDNELRWAYFLPSNLSLPYQSGRHSNTTITSCFRPS